MRSLIHLAFARAPSGFAPKAIYIPILTFIEHSTALHLTAGIFEYSTLQFIEFNTHHISITAYAYLYLYVK